MRPVAGQSHGTQPPSSSTGHPLPRRASPANSLTLRHHRLARDASLRASSGSTPAERAGEVSSPRRNSSGESFATGQSDPKKWFDHSNENPTATYAPQGAIDVDPPFFQRESDSSNEEKSYPYARLAPPKPTTTRSDSADDYRSVIDDLTVEIQQLKKELKQYKQSSPDTLRDERLFEVKVHGLTDRKKRELEATLRDFTANLKTSPNKSSSPQDGSSRKTKRDGRDSASGSRSKRTLSPSISNSRPADSAYASMSTGAHSSGTFQHRQSASSRAKSSEQKVENYLRDIPEGLHPRHTIMTHKERRQLVVRRLEQIFTGKIGGRLLQKNVPPPTQTDGGFLGSVNADGQPTNLGATHQPPTLQTQAEPSREARIHTLNQQPGNATLKKNSSGDNGSTSQSHGDQTESGRSGASSGTNPSPLMPQPPEQRATRPKDLDPDRVQNPSENMEYIRHLGLEQPELLAEPHQVTEDLGPDENGWVYLNLLCNLAQLHMINVTPDFVRSAVSELSTKFQLSPDGRKIRWRGGTEGTLFSSDSSGYASQKSPSTDETDDSNTQTRRRKKRSRPAGIDAKSGHLRKKAPKLDQQNSVASGSFHYKPMFAHRDSFNGQTTADDTLYSSGPAESSLLEESPLGASGSGNTRSRKKRRHDGAIIYYSGAPFCIDLSGDAGDVSSGVYMSSVQATDSSSGQSPLRRSNSGSSLNFKPLSEGRSLLRSNSSMDVDSITPSPDLTKVQIGYFDDVDLNLAWSEEQQYIDLHPLEPCGLGGIVPEDHFMVVVTTKRPKDDALSIAMPTDELLTPKESTGGFVRRQAAMSTDLPGVTRPAHRDRSLPCQMEYVSGHIKRLAPVPLPPPGIFFPPLSSDESSLDEDGTSGEEEDEIGSFGGQVSRRVNPHLSDDYPDGVDLSSADEDGSDPDDSSDLYEGGILLGIRGSRAQTLPDRRRRTSAQSSSAVAAAGTVRSTSKSSNAELPTQVTDRSSVATAGGASSGHSNSVREDI